MDYCDGDMWHYFTWQKFTLIDISIINYLYKKNRYLIRMRVIFYTKTYINFLVFYIYLLSKLFYLLNIFSVVKKDYTLS